MRKQVEVLAVGHAAEADTGNDLFQVTFGRLLQLSEERLREVQRQPGTAPPKSMGILEMIMFLPGDQPCPYRAGSRWTLTVDEHGKVQLDPAT